MREICTSGFDERGRETEQLPKARVTAPFAAFTVIRIRLMIAIWLAAKRPLYCTGTKGAARATKNIA
jgi:hypothetical protein